MNSKSLFFTRRGVTAALGSVLVCSTVRQLAWGQATGSYRGRVVAEWIGPRNMRLVEPFEYVAPNGRRWPVPSGVVVDGASIPQMLWSLIGGPFEGLYRAASVVHDRFCDTRTRKYPDVHQMFFEAMLTSGVGQKRAFIMYQAVARFGPRWPDPKIDPRCEIVDENYNFDLCARNAAKPAIQRPEINRDLLLQFLNEVSPEADPADVAILRRVVSG